MKTILSFAAMTALMAGTVMAQPSIRPKPGAITPNAAPLNQQKLDPASLAKRLRPPPKYLQQAEWRQVMPPNLTLAQTSAFSLTPAAPRVDGRGSLLIQGDVSIPNPLPPGFPGQAVLRYTQGGFATAVWETGVATLTIDAVKDKFYAVDCLAMLNSGRVHFKTSGADASSEGMTDAKNGHLTFVVRRTSDNGQITIRFHPERLIQEASNPLQPTMIFEKNVMDFWGCQVTPAA